jgi:hypothetical protein
MLNWKNYGPRLSRRRAEVSVTTLKRTIQVGTVTLTLKKNREVFERYEGFTENARVLISQQPWGAWQGSIVRREGKGGLLQWSQGSPWG